MNKSLGDLATRSDVHQERRSMDTIGLSTSPNKALQNVSTKQNRMRNARPSSEKESETRMVSDESEIMRSSALSHSQIDDEDGWGFRTPMSDEFWPAQMCARTLARYLDMGSTQTLYRRMKTWKEFPPKDPRTGRWDKRKVDGWLSPTIPTKHKIQSNWRQRYEEWAQSK